MWVTFPVVAVTNERAVPVLRIQAAQSFIYSQLNQRVRIIMGCVVFASRSGF